MPIVSALRKRFHARLMTSHSRRRKKSRNGYQAEILEVRRLLTAIVIDSEEASRNLPDDIVLQSGTTYTVTAGELSGEGDVIGGGATINVDGGAFTAKSFRAGHGETTTLVVSAGETRFKNIRVSKASDSALDLVVVGTDAAELRVNRELDLSGHSVADETQSTANAMFRFDEDGVDYWDTRILALADDGANEQSTLTVNLDAYQSDGTDVIKLFKYQTLKGSGFSDIDVWSGTRPLRTLVPGAEGALEKAQYFLDYSYQEGDDTFVALFVNTGGGQRVVDVGGRVAALSDLQRSGLREKQIRTVEASDIPYLSDAQLDMLSNQKLLAFMESDPSLSQFLDVSGNLFNDLSSDELLTIIPQLTVEQIGQVRPAELSFLLPDQIQHVTTDQMATVSEKRHILEISTAALARLSEEQWFAVPERIRIKIAGLRADPDLDDPDGNKGTDSGTAGAGHDHGMDTEKHLEHTRLLEIVEQTTETIVSTETGGVWSDSTTWLNGVVPGSGDEVIIVSGATVTFDAEQTESLDWVRVNGTLNWSTTIDTRMLVDTLVVDESGTLQIGSSTERIASDVTARIVIADAGRGIDTNVDPLQLSRGVVSYGTVQFYGEEVTPYLTLDEPLNEGSTELEFDAVPTNWRVGHKLVLAGDSADPENPNDEELEITEIVGNTVIVDSNPNVAGNQGLQHEHELPAGHGLKIYVANMSRNIEISSENAAVNRRGHVMFMHNQNVTVENVGFIDLGRTDKSKQLDDFRQVEDENGQLQINPGTNQRGRYAVHFHRAGNLTHGNTHEESMHEAGMHEAGMGHDMMDGMDSMPSSPQPGQVSGSVVWGSPGLGYVNHESYANFTDNIAYNVVGSSFFTEFGNEIGSFERNLSIRNVGSGDGKRTDFDKGHQGHGFWLEGPGVELVDNVSTGATRAAYMIFTISAAGVSFDVQNIADDTARELLGGDSVQSVRVRTVPLARVTGNTAIGSRVGLETWHHLNKPSLVESTIDDFTAWNVRTGVDFNYSGNIVLNNALLIGDIEAPSGTAFTHNAHTNHFTIDNLFAEGWEYGVKVPTHGKTIIRGGTIDAVTAIYIEHATNTNRSVTIEDVTLAGQTDVEMHGSIPIRQKLDEYFAPTVVRLNTPEYAGKQLYFKEQAPDAIPFPADEVHANIPVELIDKTTLELWETYGLAPGGIIAPADAVAVDGIDGLMGSITPEEDYLGLISLVSDQYVSNLENYELIYIDDQGMLVADASPVTLVPGGNVITRTVNGEKRSLVVFADVTKPVLVLRNRPENVRVSEDRLKDGLRIRLKLVRDDGSGGSRLFGKRVKDLDQLIPQYTDNGEKYVEVTINKTDVSGNRADPLTVRIFIDPVAAPFDEVTDPV